MRSVPASPGMVEHGQHILRLTHAMVVGARALAHSAKVGSQGRVAEIPQAMRKGVHDLVVVGTTKERMWVGYERQPLQGCGFVKQGLYRPSRAIDQHDFTCTQHVRNLYLEGILDSVSSGAARVRQRFHAIPDSAAATNRSEERRVGKECRSRWSPYH